MSSAFYYSSCQLWSISTSTYYPTDLFSTSSATHDWVDWLLIQSWNWKFYIPGTTLSPRQTRMVGQPAYGIIETAGVLHGSQIHICKNWVVPLSSWEPSLGSYLTFFTGRCLSWPAIIKLNRLGGLNNRNIFLTFWILGSPRSRCGSIQFLVSTCFLICTWLPSCSTLMW